MDRNKIGKRYVCPTCGRVLMCVKGGPGRLDCHGQPMEMATPKPLPSSD